jgi:DNA-binding LacI/PurR family transcriptional regulator
MSITIRDVAREAGVSPAAVSLALNGRPGIGEQTRIRVQQAAEKLGYIAQRQAAAGFKTICFLKIARHGHMINPDHNAFIADYIDGISSEAAAHGYTLEVKSYQTFDLEQIRGDLSRSQIDGAIVLATELTESDITRLSGLPLPVVFIDACYQAHQVDVVDMDNEGALYSIMKTLKDLGHRDIGLVRSTAETRNFSLREKFFQEAAADLGLHTGPRWTFSVDSTFDAAYRDMKQHLEDRRDLPSALFCVCDIIALGCMRALREAGITIGKEVSIIGFDDLSPSQMSDPPLASVQVSKTRIGLRAFELLHRRLQEHSPLPYEKILIGGSLIIRESLGTHQQI